MKSFIIFFLLMISPAYASGDHADNLPLIQAGELDLGRWDDQEFPSFPLRGEWELYWSHLYGPEDFAQGQPPGLEHFKIPGSWSLSGLHPATGHATFRLRVRMSEIKELALRTPWVFSAARVFVDGRLLGEIGTLGEPGSMAHFRPHVREQYWEVRPTRKDFDIIVQVANSDIYLTGMMSAPMLGTPQAIRRHQMKEIGIALFQIGCILVMGFYHLALFVMRRKNRSTLYFGLACFTIGTHMFFAKSSVQSVFLPDLPFQNFMQLFNVWILSSPLFCLFMNELFPKTYSRRLGWATAGLGLILWLSIVLGDYSYIAFKVFAYQFLIACISIYTFAAIITAIRHREDGAWILLIGMMLMISAFLHDILRVLYDSTPLSAFGLCAFIICQSFLLARRFSNAFAQVEKSEKDIRFLSEELKSERDHVLTINQNLEILVEEKTRDIRSIMAHIQLGIFTILPMAFRVHRDHSRHLRELFEVEEMTDLNGLELLFRNCSLAADDISQATSAMEAMLGEQAIAFELNRSCLPSEIERPRLNGDIRVLDLSWNPITNNEGIIEKILVTIRDVTDMRSLEEEAQDKKEELQFISELLNVTPESFRRFIQSCHQFTNENRKLINSGSIEHHDMDVLKVLFINMHTMKGAARSLYFKKMTRIFHVVEQYYASLQKSSHGTWDVARMNSDLDDVDAILKTYESINCQKLGRHLKPERVLTIPESNMLDFYQSLEILVQPGPPRKSGPLLRELQSFLFPYLFAPAEQVLLDIFQCTGVLARDLGKAQPHVVVAGDAIYLTGKAEDLMRKVFVHILRNSIDHGIEDPETRVQRGKRPEGTIHISIVQQAERVFLTVSDDGMGLDIDKVKAIADRQHSLKDIESLSLSEAANLIFLTGLTTTAHANDISGRGMGMDAIKQYIEEEGGQVTIKLRDDQCPEFGCYPFTLEIDLPASLFAVQQKMEQHQVA